MLVVFVEGAIYLLVHAILPHYSSFSKAKGLQSQRFKLVITLHPTPSLRGSIRAQRESPPKPNIMIHDV
jgi:hypothetical protein